MDADVIIVGAGLAGLSAGVALSKAGRSVLVFEARDRVGGRTWSIKMGRATLDIGGQWIGPGQSRMYRLVKELSLQTYPTHTVGDTVLVTKERRSTYRGAIPKLSPLKLVRLQMVLSLLERAGRKVSKTDPWLDDGAEALDRTTVDSWLDRALLGAGAKEELLGILTSAIRTIFGADPGELSMLHFLYYARSSGGLSALIETDGGLQQDRIVGGTQQISIRLAERIGLDQVLLNSPVQAIEHNKNGVKVFVKGKAYTARCAIISVPVPLINTIRFAPELPPLKRQLIQRAPMGGTVKCIALYDEPFWRKHGLSGEAVDTEGLLSVAFDNTTHDGAQASLLGFVVGRPARLWHTIEKDERRRLIVERFAKLYGPKARHLTGYREVDWSMEAFTGGCPIASFPPGTLSSVGPALRSSYGPLFWAGTETALQNTGYMDGAVESGERAVKEVLTALD